MLAMVKMGNIKICKHKLKFKLFKSLLAMEWLDEKAVI